LTAGDARGQARKGLFAWALFDWANSAYFTVILTFVFSAYFTRAVVADDVLGTELWGTAIGISGFLVAIAGPLLGATTDQTGRRKPWIGAMVLLAVLSTGALWFVLPDPGYALAGAWLAATGAFAMELAIVLYNAMLPALAGPERTGRWSGWGWALGYGGGLACLIVVLLLFVNDTLRPDFLPTVDAAHLRASFVFVALWIGLFSLPLFFSTPDEKSTSKPLLAGMRDGLGQLGQSLRNVRKYRAIVRFLVARIFYVDGLATIFAMGGVFAAGEFDMDAESILYFGIALNVTAGLGAFAFSWIDDRIGSRRTILVALAALIVSATTMLVAPTQALFWAGGLVLGVFVGPAQAASRSWLARAAPEALRDQMFGLFAFSGKATAFAGPLLVGALTAVSGSQRIGMGTIVLLLAVGFWIMLGVPDADTRDRKDLQGSAR